jgi:hypothetical protein
VARSARPGAPLSIAAVAILGLAVPALLLKAGDAWSAWILQVSTGGQFTQRLTAALQLSGNGAPAAGLRTPAPPSPTRSLPRSTPPRPAPRCASWTRFVATAPAAAADVDTRVSITVDPAAAPAAPRNLTDAITETGQALTGLESALGSCGVTVLGRARAAGLAGIVRTAGAPR